MAWIRCTTPLSALDLRTSLFACEHTFNPIFRWEVSYWIYFRWMPLVQFLFLNFRNAWQPENRCSTMSSTRYSESRSDSNDPFWFITLEIMRVENSRFRRFLLSFRFVRAKYLSQFFSHSRQLSLCYEFFWLFLDTRSRVRFRSFFRKYFRTVSKIICREFSEKLISQYNLQNINPSSFETARKFTSCPWNNIQNFYFSLV